MGRPGKDAYSLSAFKCLRCGNCCRGAGFVNVTDEECRQMAEYLDMAPEEFIAIYTLKALGYQRWLIDGEGDDKPCVFLVREKGNLSSCRVQAVKPSQCSDFPHKWRRSDAKNFCAGLLEGKDRKSK